MFKIRLPFLALALVLGLGALPSQAKVTDVHVEKSKNNVILHIRGNETLQYKLSEFAGPDRLQLTIFDQALTANREQLPVNQGQVDKVFIKQDAEHVRLTVNLRARTQYNVFTKDGNRTIVLSMRTDDFVMDSTPGRQENVPEGSGNPGGMNSGGTQKISSPGSDSSPPLPGQTPGAGFAYRDYKGNAPPPLPGYGFDSLKGGGSGSGMDKTYSVHGNQVDTSPILEHIVFQEASISDVALQLSRMTGINILVDSDLIPQSTPGATDIGVGRVSAPVTLDLKNVTLQQALDAIVKSNDWAWFKLGDNTYVVSDEETKTRGFETLSNGNMHLDTALPNDRRIVPLKNISILDVYPFASAVLGNDVEDARGTNLFLDPSRNSLFMNGPTAILDKVEQLLSNLDKQGSVTQPVYRVIPIPDDFVASQDEISELVEELIIGSTLFGLDGRMSSTSPRLSNAADLITYDIVYLPRQRIISYIGPPQGFDKLKNIMEQFFQAQGRIKLWKITLQNLPVTALEITQIVMGALGHVQGDVPRGAQEDVFYLDTIGNSVVFFGSKSEADRIKEFLEKLDQTESKATTVSVKFKNLEILDFINGPSPGCGHPLRCISQTPFYGFPLWEQDRQPDPVPNEDANSYLTNPVIVAFQFKTNSILITGPQLFVNRLKDLFIANDADNAVDTTYETVQLQYMLAADAISRLRGLMEYSSESDLQDQGEGGIFGRRVVDAINSAGGNTGGGVVTPQSNFTVARRGYINLKPSGDNVPLTQTMDRARLWYSVDVSKNSLTFRGINKAIQEAKKILNIFDKPIPMVRLDVKVLELRDTNSKNFGAQFGQNFGEFFVSTDGLDFVSGILQGYEADDNGITVTARNQLNNAKVLANPSVLVTNLTPTTLDFSDPVPVLVAEGGNINVNTERTVGITLNIIPIINNNNEITLQVAPTVRSITSIYQGQACAISQPNANGVAVRTCENNPVPVISARSISTEARVKNNVPLIIGGLMSSRETEQLNKIPFLSSLPIFGGLFKNTTKEKENVEVVIIITPTIMDSAPIAAAPTAGN